MTMMNLKYYTHFTIVCPMSIAMHYVGKITFRLCVCPYSRPSVDKTVAAALD